jgi:hypothetical protein
MFGVSGIVPKQHISIDLPTAIDELTRKEQTDTGVPSRLVSDLLIIEAPVKVSLQLRSEDLAETNAKVDHHPRLHIEPVYCGVRLSFFAAVDKLSKGNGNNSKHKTEVGLAASTLLPFIRVFEFPVSHALNTSLAAPGHPW